MPTAAALSAGEPTRRGALPNTAAPIGRYPAGSVSYAGHTVTNWNQKARSVRVPRGPGCMSPPRPSGRAK